MMSEDSSYNQVIAIIILCKHLFLIKQQKDCAAVVLLLKVKL
jgi:hypothetical protein